jgi:hypothetical protein
MCVYCYKIKCMNFGNISDICVKLNIITNYTHVPQMTHILLKKNTHLTIFNTSGGTVRNGT